MEQGVSGFEDPSPSLSQPATDKQEFKMPDLQSISRAKPKGKEEPVDPKTIDEADHKEWPGDVSSVPVLPQSISSNPKSESVHSSVKRVEPNQSSQIAKYESMISQLKSKYKEPEGAAAFDSRYGFEVLRNGSIIDNIQFKTEKSFYVIGRLPGCDITGEHPTMSRIHAILQFVRDPTGIQVQPTSQGTDPDDRDTRPGLYMYDLSSTHGTFLNKNQLLPTRYYRLRVGHVLKFGNSTRLYVVYGPDEDMEEESEKTVTELMQKRNEELNRKMKIGQDDAGNDADVGVTWGMGEDAVEESGLAINPFALDIEETELNLDNPKKSLQSWFEREGYDLVFDVSEKSSGHFICTINLPLDSANGMPVIAEVDGKGKKKEIMAQCALKACQILDKYGVLRKSNQERLKRKSKDWEERDYYSSDEDTFLDRTGSVERKRKFRMKQAGKLEEKAETYDSLVSQYQDISSQVDELERKIEKARQRSTSSGGNGITDSLDEFMQDIKTGVTDISKMKSKTKELAEEQGRLLKLINLVKPVGATFTASHLADKNLAPAAKELSGKPKAKILFGPRRGLLPPKQLSNQVAISKIPKMVSSKPTSTTASTLIAEMIHIDNDDDDDEITPSPVSVEVSDSKPAVSSSNSKALPVDVLSVQDESVRKEEEPDVSSSTSENTGGIRALPQLNSDEDDEAVPEPKKQTRKRQRRLPKTPVEYEYDSSKPEYSVWVPPADQSGDGKTKLNEKLGY